MGAHSVQECTQEIVAQLTMRAGGGAGGSALLQSQDDVSRVQALLLLQSDRYVRIAAFIVSAAALPLLILQ